MSITDEHWSAFLDNELPEETMAQVRAALTEEESLADRLAELALVDQLVASAYRRIDTVALPAAVVAQVKQEPATAAHILPFVGKKRWTPALRALPAIAATVMVMVGLAMVMSRPSPEVWPEVAQMLESTPSGVEVILSNGDTVMSRLTFRVREGSYCRHFQHRQSMQVQEAVACRRQGAWELLAQYSTGTNVNNDSYQTASGSQRLDALLDEWAAAPLSLNAEAALLNSAWVVEVGGDHASNKP